MKSECCAGVWLTVSWTQSSRRWDHGQRGAGVGRAKVMLHVWRDVWVRREEAGLAGRSRRQTDQRDVRDQRTARQTCRTGEKNWSSTAHSPENLSEWTENQLQRFKQPVLRVKDCPFSRFPSNESQNRHKRLFSSFIEQRGSGAAWLNCIF